MKKTLLHFKARWLLLVAMLFCVFGTQAQETWYLFDSYVADGQARATFTNPDADGNYVVSSFTTAGARSNNFGFTNSPNPSSDNATAKFLGTSPSVTITEPGTYDLIEIDHGTLYNDQNCFRIGDGDEWVITFNPTTMKVTFSYPMPDTLYLVDWQKSFASADNDGNGIYVFESITVPDNSYPYYGFANSAAPAGASLIVSAVSAEEATSANNVDISLNQEYPLAFTDHSAIDGMRGSFVIKPGTYDITLDWNAMTVKFTEPVIPAPDKLYLVDLEKSYGEAENNGNGVYVFESVTIPTNDNPYYGFANASAPNGADVIVSAVSSADATTSNNISVVSGEEYPFALSNFDAIFGGKGTYVINPGTYNITLDWEAKTVKFTKAAIPAPDELYLSDYQKSYGKAVNNGQGIFEFESITPTSGCPYFGFTPTETPNQAPWVLGTVDYATAQGAGTHGYNIDVVLGEEYPFEFSDYQAIYDEKGSFVLGSTPVNITLDWNAMTVKFTEPVIPAPDKLYLIDFEKSFGEAENDGNGVYRFEAVSVSSDWPYYGFADNPTPRSASIIVSAASAGEASSANNVTVEYDEEYTFDFSNFDAINDCIGSYIINEGTYDITLDWDAKTVKFTEPVIPAPDKLYLVDCNKSFGEAENNGNGVYVFESVMVPFNENPYYGFANASNPNGADVIVSAISAPDATTQNNVTVELDEEYPFALSSYDAINTCKGSYVINSGLYNITLDWEAKTVKFTKAEMPAPDQLYIIDYKTNYGSAVNNGQGVFEFEDIELTSDFAFYGFAPTDDPKAAPWALGTADYATASAAGHHGCNIQVQLGEEYTFEFTDSQAMYDEIGSFEYGSTPVNITLDWNKQTVKFWTKPLEQPANLYATTTYLDDLLGSCTNDGNGMYRMVIDVESSSAQVVFTNSKDFKNEEGETIYYGTTEGKISDVEYEKEYGFGLSDYQTVWGDQTGLYLSQGRYKLDIDFVGNTIVVHDISRGDIWVTPATLNMYNDEMEQIAVSEQPEEGVFQFDNVELKKATNIVFTDDPTATGKFFGSSMKGERSLDVKNYRTYDLYIPTYQEINIDGLAGFMVPAGTWSIKVDMNAKNVSFVDSEATYIPEQLDVAVDGETTSNLAEGEGSYIWKVTLAKESDVTFSDPLIGRTYGSPEADATITAGTEYAVAELTEDALHAFKVPAGTWEVVMNLKKGKITFYEYEAISLVESTHKDGDKFYSYYGAGTDPMLTLTFSGNPYTIASAILAFGDYTPGMTKDTETCKIEKINVYRSGNTLFTSFAGKVRSIPEGAEPKVTLVITSIKSVHGLLAETDAIEGLPAGSLMYTFDFEEFQPIAIESKLLDAEGKALDADDVLNVDEMEIVTLMVKPFNLITFDGVNLTAAAAEEADDAAPATVSLDWKAGEEDADGFTPIYVTLPMSIRGAGQWNLSLANLNADDNTGEHGAEVSHAIETLVHPADVVTANPENGTTVDELQYIVVKWDHSLVKSVGYKGTEEPVVTVTGDNGESYTGKLEVISTLGGNELQIHISKEIVNAGTYKVVIPAGSVVLNNNEGTNVNDIELEYTVTGVSSVDNILADDPDAEVIVCTISGIVVRKGRAADVISNLKEGIYIINGEKVHIRK